MFLGPTSTSQSLCPLASCPHPSPHVPRPHVHNPVSMFPALCPHPSPRVPWPHVHIPLPVTPGLLPTSQPSCSLAPCPYCCPHVHIPVPMSLCPMSTSLSPCPWPCVHIPVPVSISQSQPPVLVSIPVPMSISTCLSRCLQASHPYPWHIPVSPGLLSIPIPTSPSHSPTTEPPSHYTPQPRVPARAPGPACPRTCARPPRRLLKGSGGKRGGAGPQPIRTRAPRLPSPARQSARRPHGNPFPAPELLRPGTAPPAAGTRFLPGKDPPRGPPFRPGGTESPPRARAAFSPHLARAVAAARRGALRRRRLCSSAMAAACGRP